MPDELSKPSPATVAAFPGRRPSQKRSQVRVDVLLNAAEQMLMEREANDFGLYDIAHAAGVPPTSAYHFFPSKESVFLALAERYLQRLHGAVEAPLDFGAIERWPDLIAVRYQRTVDFFNGSLPARKLLIGPAVGSDIKNMDLVDIDSHAAACVAWMNRLFDMPYVRDPVFKFTVLIGIYDGIWMSSYARHGYITPAYAKEGLAAGLAYLETFLPRTIALRDPKDLPASGLEWTSNLPRGGPGADHPSPVKRPRRSSAAR